MSPRLRPPLALASAAAVTLVLAACGGDDGGAGTTAAGLGSGGSTIPTTTAAAATPAPVLTTAAGAPKVVQFKASPHFWCLKAHPEQAQTTIGWSVPSATRLRVLLDGKPVRKGIRRTLPFAVVAGPPSGIGVTVVFPCASGDRHRITLRWAKGAGPVSQRTVTIRKARS